MVSFRILFVSLLLGFGMLGCSTRPDLIDTAAQVAAAPETLTAYQLGSGDKLRVIVFGEKDLSGEFVVDGSGTISMPLVGEIDAAGDTIRDFQKALVDALADGYLTDPRVSAEVLNFRPFYILGEIENAGEYPYLNGLSVLNAIATAGGFTYRANRKIVYIKHAGDTEEKSYELSGATLVQPGDTIRLAERFF